MRIFWFISTTLRIMILLLCMGQVAEGQVYEQIIDEGIDLLTIVTKQGSFAGDSRITVIRINPYKWELIFVGKSLTGEKNGKTAREWCESNNLTGAINAGMFNSDYHTHTGFLKYKDHINSRYINNYKSVVAFDPVDGKDLPRFKIYDLENPGIDIPKILENYSSVIQNLRLIKKPGINVWSRSDRMWSEAAIGEDKNGNILFIFSEAPFSMYDFNNELLNSGIGIVAAQHLEGGPEAQLYIKTGTKEIEMGGSYETGFYQNNDNMKPWPVPNILGIRKIINK